MNMPAPHIPVLMDEAVAALAIAPGETHVDGTFGAGGYSQAMLDKGAARVFAFDRDPQAIEAGEDIVAASGGRLTLVPERFSRMRQALRDHGVDEVDGVTLDIGVSSMQLDQGERGFSFLRDGDLDMRMTPRPKRRRHRQWRGRSRAGRHPLPFWRREKVAPGRPRDRRGAAADPHRRTGRRGAQGARPSCRHEEGSGDADLPGAAHRRE